MWREKQSVEHPTSCQRQCGSWLRFSWLSSHCHFPEGSRESRTLVGTAACHRLPTETVQLSWLNTAERFWEVSLLFQVFDNFEVSNLLFEIFVYLTSYNQFCCLQRHPPWLLEANRVNTAADRGPVTAEANQSCWDPCISITCANYHCLNSFHFRVHGNPRIFTKQLSMKNNMGLGGEEKVGEQICQRLKKNRNSYLYVLVVWM